jgi:hypothetical protein
MNLGTSWEMLQPLHLWYPLEWSVVELHRKSRQFTQEKSLFPPPVIRTQFFGHPTSSLVNKMTNVYIFLPSTLRLYNAPLPSCTKGKIITDRQKIMQSKINATCTYIHSDTLHKLQPDTESYTHAFVILKVSNSDPSSH